MTAPLVLTDPDEARYVGDEEDGCYVNIAQAPGGWWYVTVWVDCNTAHFTEDLLTDDGPYRTEAEAWQAGEHVALDWCLTNGVGTK